MVDPLVEQVMGSQPGPRNVSALSHGCGLWERVGQRDPESEIEDMAPLKYWLVAILVEICRSHSQYSLLTGLDLKHVDTAVHRMRSMSMQLGTKASPRQVSTD